MKICIENDDKISVRDNCIEICTKSDKYCFDSSEIAQIDMITTDKGPFYDDMCLAVKISRKDNADNAVIFIMSGHPLFKKFLFDELKQLVDLNYEAIIEASACVENRIFPVYKR